MSDNAGSTTAGRRYERPWMRPVLLAAGVYNLVWGAATILAPGLLFDLIGAERPRYPELWQCIGMIVGVYGVGYAIAAYHPLRHWPIVLVGLLGKLFGPIGFAFALVKGTFPAAFGWTIVTNDLIWWVPFAAILWAALKQNATVPETDSDIGSPLNDLASSNGRTLAELSQDRPVFLVLLRHAGCTFCREALADLRAARDEVAAAGAQLAVVHMSAQEGVDHAFGDAYSLDDTPQFADPKLQLYRLLELPKGRFGQLFGWSEFTRGAKACLVDGHGVGSLEGDGFQLGGLALIDQGQVVWRRALGSASERPNYGAEARAAIERTLESTPAQA